METHIALSFLLNTLKGTKITLPSVILYYSTLSSTNRQIFTPKRYDKHPRHFYRGVVTNNGSQKLRDSWMYANVTRDSRLRPPPPFQTLLEVHCFLHLLQGQVSPDDEVSPDHDYFMIYSLCAVRTKHRVVAVHLFSSPSPFLFVPSGRSWKLLIQSRNLAISLKVSFCESPWAAESRMNFCSKVLHF